MRTLWVAFLLPLVSFGFAGGKSFTVLVYSVENLMDVDGVASYWDYQPDRYTPAHLGTKLTNIARVLAQVDQGKGPDIIFFTEIEIDQRPSPGVARAAETMKWLRTYAAEDYRQLLGRHPLPPAIADASATTWLLKALSDHGMSGYEVIESNETPSLYEGTRYARAVQNVIFTRFPVRAVRHHPTRNARSIVEAEISVDGHPLYVFANHWKAGASSPRWEEDRLQNAQVLRRRIDELLSRDRRADILIGGDLNSHYNQSARYPKLGETGINDVLRAQGNELALIKDTADLYDLWFELPYAERRSDWYKGEWGTLVHLIVSRGLYDGRGVHYVDNSFHVLALPGLNRNSYGLPFRWSFEGVGGQGFSDHFPIYAQFVVNAGAAEGAWMPLEKPTQEDEPSGEPLRWDYRDFDLAEAVRIEEIGQAFDLRDGSWTGKVFRVEGESEGGGHLKVRFAEDEYDVFSPDPKVRDLLYKQRNTDGKLFFYGELGTHKGAWQFLVRDKRWVGDREETSGGNKAATTDTP